MSAISITMRRTVISFAALLTAAAELEFDHVWIVVSRDAPERAALERAGFKISPNVNRNDGQGTASVSTSKAGKEHEWTDWGERHVRLSREGSGRAQRELTRYNRRLK